MEKVILDVDTGTDDAIAIMTALQSPELEVMGICSVNGNRGIEFTTGKYSAGSRVYGGVRCTGT